MNNEFSHKNKHSCTAANTHNHPSNMHVMINNLLNSN